MKRVIVSMVIGLFLFLGISSSAFCAQRGHYGGGGYHGGGGHYGGGGYYYRYGGPRVFIGGYLGYPFYDPFWYYPYYGRYYYPYYYPYGYSYSYPYQDEPDADVAPPVSSELEQKYYWYYCKDTQSYYPYVTSCPGGWTKVEPTPP